MRRNESDYGTGLRSFLIIECSEVISYPNLFTVYLPSNLFTATNGSAPFILPLHLLSIYYPSITHLLPIYYAPIIHFPKAILRAFPRLLGTG
jgi:hypothetical protein